MLKVQDLLFPFFLQETLQSNLAFLEKEKEEFNPEGETRSNMLMGMLASEQQKLRAAFEQLQQFLKEQEGTLLAQFDEAHERLTEQHQEYVCRVSERRTLLEELVVEIQKKRDQPAVGFLMDIAGILDRCMEAKLPVPEPVSPELQRTVSNLCKMSEQVQAVLGDFRVNLLSKLDTERVKVLLDLETASPYLTISSDCRTLQIAEGQQDLPDTPKRFTGTASVLGSEGFTAGRHYWELEVGDGNNWAVGVALESVQRKEPLMVAMEKIWALRMDWDRSYTMLTMPPAPLSLEEEPRRIRVHLDYEAGQVTFYNTDNMQQILQFKVSFREKVFPYFWLWLPGTSIKLCS
ncbi:E3 ubiquitin-protein ligase TRIM7-like isoform X2 [Meleagris gallopavo]|uniref:B30.2/SPRY domain-containing protein n=1 Tax=Meleagris gallopavo TaxID=9103 RepID=A0A803Y2Q5_MELGA|nr:E3 ubiquitin-protein ligase TRIM7-like isoform X2 [Meleagris gallopavo]